MVDPIVEITSAAMLAGFIVAFAKMATPSMSSAALAGVSVAAGIAVSFLIGLQAGVTITTASAAGFIIQGILAAATAAGLTRADERGETKRKSEAATEGDYG